MKQTETSNNYITPDEYPYIWFGELSESDFYTSAPNPCRIGKIATGINRYIAMKKRKQTK